MAKHKIEWSTDAKLDLLDILDFYIKKNSSTTYSKKLNSKINKSIQLISKNPNIATSTEYNSVRALITDDFQIIYEIFNQLILIIMIWDCRQNPDLKRIGQRKK